MHNFTNRQALIKQVDNVRTRRALRRNGFTQSVRQVCALVDAGSTRERTVMTSRLLAVCHDELIEALVVAAFSGYVGGLVADSKSVDMSHRDKWSIGLEALVRAVQASARSEGGDFHIIRSTSRDFGRAMVRYRRDARGHAEALRLLYPTRYEPRNSFEEELTSVSIDELVEWVATQFDTELATARMVVATRLGGFALGPSEGSTKRARNCRERQRVEARIRGFISPAEGLADNVLSRAA